MANVSGCTAEDPADREGAGTRSSPPWTPTRTAKLTSRRLGGLPRPSKGSIATRMAYWISRMCPARMEVGVPRGRDEDLGPVRGDDQARHGSQNPTSQTGN
jgi:hypothetical protein